MLVEPREPPVETIHGLRPPRAGFPYFAHAEKFPFDPGAVADSPVNAWWLADASFLAYGDAELEPAGSSVHRRLAAAISALDWR